jgi:hypothetical protein
MNRLRESNYLRIVDETGEDYLFPASHFVFIDVPPEAAETLTVQIYGTLHEIG